MKKIFILAIVATIASFSFAQSARSLKPGQKFSVQRVMTSADLTKATETRKFEQTKAEKAKAVSKSSDNRQKTALSQRIFSPTAKVVSNHFNARPLALNAPHKAYKASKTEQRDEHGIIIAPAEGDTTYYKRTGHCYYYDYYVCYDMQSGHIAIVECENGDVYIKDPVCKFAEGTWVKGAKNGNTITVATNQPVAYSEDYNATVSLRWCAFDNNGNMIAAKDAPDHFTYTIDGNVITLEGSSYELLMGIVWDDNNEATGYADYQTVLTADPGYKPASREPVKIPEGLATETWYGRGAIYASGSSERYKKPLTLGFDGNDVYVQGIFNEFPEAWIKGKIENGVATFPSMQYLGKLYTYDIWISGLTYDDYNPVLEDFVMNFDAATKTFTAVNEIVENSMEDQLSYVFRIIGLKISAEEPYTGPTTVPYFCPVQTLDDLDEFAIIDANNDNYIWELYEG